jgi:hypothetical protein
MDKNKIEQQMNVLGIKSVSIIKERDLTSRLNFFYINVKVHSITIDKEGDMDFIMKIAYEYLTLEVQKLYDRRNSIIDKIINNG